MAGFSLQDLLDEIGEQPARRKPVPPQSSTSSDMRLTARSTLNAARPKLSGPIPVPPLRDDAKRTLVSGLLAALGQAVTAREPNSLGSALGRFAGQLAQNQAAQQYTDNLGTGRPDPISARLLTPEQVQAIRSERENALYKQAVMAQMVASSARKDAETMRPVVEEKDRPLIERVVLPNGPDGKAYPNGFQYYVDKVTKEKTPIGPVVKSPTAPKSEKKETVRVVGSGMTSTIQGLLALEFLPEVIAIIKRMPNANLNEQLNALKDPLTRNYRPDAIFALLPPESQRKWIKGQAEYAAAYQKSGEVLSTQVKRMAGGSEDASPEVAEANGALNKAGIAPDRDRVAATMLIQKLNKIDPQNPIEITDETIDKVWQNPNLQNELRKILRSLK